MAYILVVDDEEKMRHLLSIMLGRSGHRVSQAADGLAALEMIKANAFDLVITDIKMPNMCGTELLLEMQKCELSCPVVFITAFATVDSAVETMRSGAADYITKPFDEDRILLTVERTLNLSRVMAENRELKAALLKATDADQIVCASPEMKQVVALASKVAKTDSAVLIQGESGTGKELISRFIHHESNRRKERFVAINCAAISPTLVESELFGYEKGAFTGAERRTQGRFEFADKGTLFMDEIGDLSLDAQAKLLRALQEKKIRRVGGNEEIEVDVRLICATNRNLQARSEEGAFRQDLLFRINVFPIELPPLRIRKADIVPLSRFFIDRFSKGNSITLTEGAERLLMEYPWPGNVRELANALERAIILSSDQGGISAETLFFLRKDACKSSGDRPFLLPPNGISIEALQQDLVKQALEMTGYNQTLAARMLGLSRAKFRVLMKYANT